MEVNLLQNHQCPDSIEARTQLEVEPACPVHRLGHSTRNCFKSGEPNGPRSTGLDPSPSKAECGRSAGGRGQGAFSAVRSIEREGHGHSSSVRQRSCDVCGTSFHCSFQAILTDVTITRIISL